MPLASQRSRHFGSKMAKSYCGGRTVMIFGFALAGRFPVAFVVVVVVFVVVLRCAI
jgi:hypothetical protein